MPESANVPALVVSFLLPLAGGTWLFWRAGRPFTFAATRGLWMTLYAVIPVMLFAFLAAGAKQFTGFNVFPLAPVVVLLFFAWVSTFRRTTDTDQRTSMANEKELAEMETDFLETEVSIVSFDQRVTRFRIASNNALVDVRNDSHVRLVENPYQLPRTFPILASMTAVTIVDGNVLTSAIRRYPLTHYLTLRDKYHASAGV